MTDRWKEFWLGLFIIVAMGLAAWLILFLKPSVGDGKVRLTVRFSNIDRVSQGTLVTFAGRQVGEVEEIREIPNPRQAPADAYGNLFIFELTLKVDSSVRIFVYDEIIFTTSGLLGEKSIAIIPKAPPPGAPPAFEVTHELLFARSTDRLEQTLNQLVGVAGTFQDTLEEITAFIENNNLDLNAALKSLTSATSEMHKFMEQVNESDLIHKTSNAVAKVDEFFAAVTRNHFVERLGESFDAIYEVATLFSEGQGTIARLVNSDCFYVQLTTVLCQMQTILNNVQNYGLLYQFDRKWQRLNDVRRCCTEIPIQPYCEN